MREDVLPPNAPALLNSLRAIGYSFDSALADILDNSIAAGATKVQVQLRVGERTYIAVVDDGHGMSATTLRAAMQHGGIGPDSVRHSDDLGRFGLGLKTASLSQCRQLTVATVRDGNTSGAKWDLNRVEATGGWTFGVLEPTDLASVPHLSEVQLAGHGTVVLWEDFDRAVGGEADAKEALTDQINGSHEHLGLVFHRYIQAESGQRQVEISINSVRVEPKDPFLVTRSTRLPQEYIHVEGDRIVFTPFILPHRSKLTKKQLAEVDGHDGLRRSQGFYVYRNRRLITSGTWFRLMRQHELTKLARVRVDIPNSLDHLWQLDVKKSTATPPQQVRVGLLQVIEQIGGTSKRVYTHRGWKTKGSLTRVWDRLDTARGVTYRVNREHPAVTALEATADPGTAKALGSLLAALEMTLPFDAIYADMAAEREVAPTFEDVEVEASLRVTLERIVLALRTQPEALEAALANAPAMEPFASYPEITKRLIRGMRS